MTVVRRESAKRIIQMCIRDSMYIVRCGPIAYNRRPTQYYSYFILHFPTSYKYLTDVFRTTSTVYFIYLVQGSNWNLRIMMQTNWHRIVCSECRNRKYQQWSWKESGLSTPSSSFNVSNKNRCFLLTDWLTVSFWLTGKHNSTKNEFVPFT